MRLTPLPLQQREAASRLLFSAQLINQAIGDALSDMLFVEAVLTVKGWSLSDWDAIYTDLPRCAHARDQGGALGVTPRPPHPPAAS